MQMYSLTGNEEEQSNSGSMPQFDTLDEAILFIVGKCRVHQETYAVARTTGGKFLVFMFLNGLRKMPSNSQFIGYFNLLQRN